MILHYVLGAFMGVALYILLRLSFMALRRRR
jgi:hypothetical protein